MHHHTRCNKTAGVGRCQNCLRVGTAAHPDSVAETAACATCIADRPARLELQGARVSPRTSKPGRHCHRPWLPAAMQDASIARATAAIVAPHRLTAFVLLSAGPLRQYSQQWTCVMIEGSRLCQG